MITYIVLFHRDISINGKPIGGQKLLFCISFVSYKRMSCKKMEAASNVIGDCSISSITCFFLM